MCPARIQLDRCDIITVKADVCVCSIHRSRNMKVFPLSKHILKNAGATVQTELDKKYSNSAEFRMGQVEMTEAGNLKHFQKLLFICLKSYVEGNEKFLLQSLIECLELAALDKHSSVAVPALGTGGLNYPPVEVAKATIEAVALHNLQYGEETSIEKVNIVLLDSDIELIKTYLRMCVAGSTNLNEPDRTEAGSQKDGPGLSQSSPPNLRSTTATNSRQQSTPPQVMKSNKSVVRPSGFWNFLSSIFSYTYSAGLFQFKVQPTFDGRFLGLKLQPEIDIFFLLPFLPDSCKDFFENLKRQRS